jgi:hypothetical protein
MMYRCLTCSRDSPRAFCPYCNAPIPESLPSNVVLRDGKLFKTCACGCGQLHAYDPSYNGKTYKDDEPWVQMLDRHARNFLDIPPQKDFDKEPLNSVNANPVKAGIFVKLGPKAEGLRYLNRLMKSVMISDVKQPMVIWLHGWAVGGDPKDTTAMSDIYMGRDQGVPMLAKQMADDGILAMIDQDIVLPPKWYSHIREVFDSDPTIGALYPMVQLEADTAIQLIQVEYQGGWPSGGYGPNTIHNYNPDLPAYIHKGRGLVYLTDAKIMGTIAWRCTDMAVFYRASMVKDGLQYTHDWYRWKLKQGFKAVIDKDFAVAHYKEFQERGFGFTNKQVPFYACRNCNHICCWGEQGGFLCPTCKQMAVKIE